jgi:hypothetical protein
MFSAINGVFRVSECKINPDEKMRKSMSELNGERRKESGIRNPNEGKERARIKK